LFLDIERALENDWTVGLTGDYLQNPTSLNTFNTQLATIALFLDIERAFEKVWTSGPIAKLITVKIPPPLIHAIHNYCYLQNRSFSVMHRNSYSSLCPIQTGLPQGILLGPTLFNIYINEISSVENESNAGISVYADDTNISVRSGSIDIVVRMLKVATGLTVVPDMENKVYTKMDNCTVFQMIA
jgi:hypothetical protein